MRRIPWLFTAALALVTVPGVAVGQASGQPDVMDSTRIALGRKLFESKGLCFSCHGKRGEGLLGPTTQLVGRPFTHTNGTVAELTALIKAGIAADRSHSKLVMPARGGSRLTDSEVESVALYVKHLNSTTPPSSKGG